MKLMWFRFGSLSASKHCVWQSLIYLYAKETIESTKQHNSSLNRILIFFLLWLWIEFLFLFLWFFYNLHIISSRLCLLFNLEKILLVHIQFMNGVSINRLIKGNITKLNLTWLEIIIVEQKKCHIDRTNYNDSEKS